MTHTDTVVVDANLVMYAATTPRGFAPFSGRRLVGPPLLASEFRAVLHLALWAGRIHQGNAGRAFDAVFRNGSVEFIDHPSLGDEAWRIADEMGWGRTYDAEYLALAHLLDCNLVTSDLRLRRGAERTGRVLTPDELLAGP